MSNTLYETDFSAWLDQQAGLLRRGDLAALDLENLAEEIESLGRSQRRELASRVTVLLMHLLKWDMQPDERSNSWRNTINGQRRELERLLKQSPSLRRTLPDVIASEYDDAKADAVEETGLVQYPVPLMCPFSPAQVMDRAFPTRLVVAQTQS